MIFFSTRLVLPFVCLLFILPVQVFSEDSVRQLDPLKIKATRSTSTAENSTSAITIITREQIQKSKHIQVEDILRQAPGLNIVQSGPMGSNASIFMRGTGTSSTLMMIDGVQVNLNTTGSYDFRDLNLDNIEQIEILRGPQSNLWGADAVGGVINVVTRRGKNAPSHYFKFEGGSFSTFKETAGSSGKLKYFDYSVSASRTDTDGFSAANENQGNSENDGYEATNVSTRLGYDFLDDGRVEFIGRFTKSISNFDAFSFSTGLPVDGPNYNKSHTYYAAVPIIKSLTDWWDTKLNLNLSYDDFQSIDSSFQIANIINRTYTADFQNNFEFGKNLSALLGAEYQILNGTNVEQGLHENTYQSGYYFQGTYNYQDTFILTAGLRHDVNSRFKNKTTYKVEGSYRIEKAGTTIRASRATGFRGPTLNDLFFPGFSNPNLQPEESENWEFGAHQILWDDRIELGVTYFNSNLDDLIQFDFATLAPKNVSKAKSQGIETFIDIKFSDAWKLSFNHTWNQAVDGTGAPLRRRAKHKFNATIENTCGKLESLLGIYYKSNIRDASFSADGFTVVRAVVSYEIMENLKITTRGENLFDEDYEEIPNFGTQGISVFAGFNYNF